MTERVRLGAAALVVAVLGLVLFAVWPRPEVEAPELTVVRSAMTAWGAFAGSGELEQVARWFDVDGPQYARFAEEAPAIRPGPSYIFTVSHAETVAPGVVRAVVAVERAGEPTQGFVWDIELVAGPGGLRVWTVRSSPPPS